MSKNYTEVLIDGVVYTLGGAEEEEYLRRVAAYLNDKITAIRRQDGFRKMSSDDRQLMIQLNIADDYFKEQARAKALAGQKSDLEKDTYSLKHELVTTQLRLESVQRELDFEKKKVADLEKSAESLKEMAQMQKALIAAGESAGDFQTAAGTGSTRQRRKSSRKNGGGVQTGRAAAVPADDGMAAGEDSGLLAADRPSSVDEKQ